MAKVEKARRRARRPSKKPSRWIVFWWQNQTPYLSTVDDEVAAAAAASVRNAALIEIAGEVLSAVDYWRRKDDGTPMPFERREVVAPPPIMPWMRRGVREGKG